MLSNSFKNATMDFFQV